MWICAPTTFSFFVLRTTTTRGHPYKLFKCQCTSTVRSSSFTERAVNIWNNCLPDDAMDFSSLPAFKRTIKRVNFSEFLNIIAVLLMLIGYMNFVYSVFFMFLLGRLLVLDISALSYLLHLLLMYFSLCNCVYSKHK